MFKIADLENDSEQKKSYIETKIVDTPNFPYRTFSLFKILIKVFILKTVS